MLERGLKKTPEDKIEEDIKSNNTIIALFEPGKGILWDELICF